MSNSAYLLRNIRIKTYAVPSVLVVM